MAYVHRKDASGTLYFTDVSQKFRHSNLLVDSTDSTGIFISYAPLTGNVTVFMPTGLAVSSDNSYVLISQLGNNTISKDYLTCTNANTLQTFVNGIYRPANVSRSLDGNDYYVPQITLPYIHYLVKIDISGAVVGNATIAGPYFAALYYRDAQQIGPSTFLVGSQFTRFLGIVFVPILGF